MSYPPNHHIPHREPSPIAKAASGMSWAVAIPLAFVLGPLLTEALWPVYSMLASRTYGAASLESAKTILMVASFFLTLFAVRLIALAILLVAAVGISWVGSRLMPVGFA
ncbi:hypothetical protein [Accumulibacter sp.]|uniref:hypothetical protein n=1 Tax=Accumulibacter sp. TaxID=2053492 RepID=UPI00258ED9D4|nr:hypothetical protein [Accumulibacter sp.]